MLGLAICLASGVKAQFYDSADDIYYYVEYRNGDYVENGDVYIFNFDGQKGVRCGYTVNGVKSDLKKNPNYYEDAFETAEYDLVYVSSNTYKLKLAGEAYDNYYFSHDRSSMTLTRHFYKWDGNLPTPPFTGYGHYEDKITEYRKVDKSFFKVGRSRTPSGTMHE